VDGYYDDNVYFNNPPAFIPGAHSEHFQWMNIILGTAEHDFCKGANYDMARILTEKGIRYRLDVKRHGNHDWPVWREMFPEYLSTIQ
jgi:esterase/lipase superfamily enzyme